MAVSTSAESVVGAASAVVCVLRVVVTCSYASGARGMPTGGTVVSVCESGYWALGLD